MKKTLMMAAAACAAVACANIEASYADDHSNLPEIDYQAIADRVVNESAEVTLGDVVLITTTVSELELAEALVEAVWIAGGEPMVQVGFPEANKAGVMGMSPEALAQTPPAQLAMVGVPDVAISASGVEDPALFADVPEEKLNAWREAYAPLNGLYEAQRVRQVSIGQTGGIPTPAYAESQGADYAAMRSMFLEALAVSSEDITARGNVIQAKMTSDGETRVTSPSGTDITFELADKPERISAGIASANDTGTGPMDTYLPAGDYYACVDPASANGVIVEPKATIRGASVTDLTFTVENGMITSVEGEGPGAEAMLTFFDSVDDDSKTLAVVNLGLNPISQPMDGSDYLSWEMAGVATLVFGTSLWAGCDVAGEAFYEVHQAEATVTSNGTEVVTAGVLALD